jgi:hypothetical protein
LAGGWKIGENEFSLGEILVDWGVVCHYLGVGSIG